MREGQDRTFARVLRRESTEPERLLWHYLRRKQLDGFRFRRQAPIGPYFADFACLEARLIIELDGGQHNLRTSDEIRDRYLMEAAFEVLRVWNNELMSDPADVCEVILDRLRARAAPTLTLPRTRGRG